MRGPTSLATPARTFCTAVTVDQEPPTVGDSIQHAARVAPGPHGRHPRCLDGRARSAIVALGLDQRPAAVADRLERQRTVMRSGWVGPHP